MTKSANSLISKEIQKRMIDLGIDRSELARRMGISRSAVSHALNDTRRSLSIRFLARVADALDSSVEIKITPHPIGCLTAPSSKDAN